MIEEEQRQAERKRRERDEQHLYLTAKVWIFSLVQTSTKTASQVITDQTFQQHQGFDLATFEEKNWPPSELPTFRVLKQEPYLKFKARVAQTFNLTPDRIRLWVLVGRQNKTVRPDVPIPDHDPAMSMFNRYESLTYNSNKFVVQLWRLLGTLWQRGHLILGSLWMFAQNKIRSTQSQTQTRL